MFKFIKSNKMFIFFLSIVIGFIGFVGISSIIESSSEVPPVVENPEPPKDNGNDEPIKEKKELEINSFTGNFSDSKNTILFKWKITENDARINKVEIYKDNLYLQSVTNKSSVEYPIQSNGITTGANTFTLRVTTEAGHVVEKEITVQVDYLFDVSMTSQFVDNNLGKGVLLSITYSYHKKTPVGIPSLYMDTTLMGYYQHHYLERKTTRLENDYEKTTAYYFMTFDQTNQTNVTWDVHYNFASVGVTENDVIVRDISNIEYESEDIQLPSMESNGE